MYVYFEKSNKCDLFPFPSYLLTQVKMDLQLHAAPQNYPSSTGTEPLPLRAGAMNAVGWGVPRFYPMMDYGYLDEWPLPTCDHPTEWVYTKSVDMTKFKGKGNPAHEYGPGICQHLQDDYALGQEVVFGGSPMSLIFTTWLGTLRRPNSPII